MKISKVFLVLLYMGILAESKATVRTVNNSGAAQYPDLDAAYSAASNNDTLLVSGAALSYAITATSWAKNLVVIGTGFNSQKQNFQDVKFDFTGSSFFFISTTCVFKGVRFINNVNLSAPVNILTFEDCLFDGDFFGDGNTYSNVVFLNCVFTQTGKNFTCNNSNVSSILFSHCIFGGYINGSNNSLPFGVTVDHCIFLRSADCFINVYNLVVSNCIFNGSNPIGDIYNSTFTHNISRFSVSGGWSNNGNTSINNIDATNPGFVGVNANAIYSNAMNFHLNPGSPAISAATDGGDIGIHDSSSTFNEAGEPLEVPVIRIMEVLNTNVPLNGNVNVKVRSTKAR